MLNREVFVGGSDKHLFVLWEADSIPPSGYFNAALEDVKSVFGVLFSIGNTV